MTQEDREAYYDNVTNLLFPKFDKWVRRNDLAVLHDTEIIDEADGTHPLCITFVDDQYHPNGDEDEDLYIHIYVKEPKNFKDPISLYFSISSAITLGTDEMSVPPNAMKVFSEAQRRIDRYNKERELERQKKKKLEDFHDENMEY